MFAIIKIMTRKRLAAGILVFGAIALFSLSSIQWAHAQSASPQFLITWKTTGSYVPPSYIGKALPTYGSKITASLELISKNKLVDLSSQTIYWYLNDTLLGGGTGVQAITFPPFGTPPRALVLKVELPSYNGNFLIHTIQIPMVSPTAVIYAPFPNDRFSAHPLVVSALPYFFNTAATSSLVFSWSVNNETNSSAENPIEADITLPPGTAAGTTVSIGLSVENPLDSTVANAASNFTYQPIP